MKTITSSLPAITKSYTINGAGITVDGAGNYQAFQVASGVVLINTINIRNAVSKGGDGGAGYSGGGVGGASESGFPGGAGAGASVPEEATELRTPAVMEPVEAVRD